MRLRINDYHAPLSDKSDVFAYPWRLGGFRLKKASMCLFAQALGAGAFSVFLLQFASGFYGNFGFEILACAALWMPTFCPIYTSIAALSGSEAAGAA